MAAHDNSFATGDVVAGLEPSELDEIQFVVEENDWVRQGALVGDAP